ncbi:hypothetical protein EZ456_07510 [Pedobacter psychrodurus]|uniref:Transglutaminase superfamily protein n=1 Tax=Pedobacter psychrodurus TaxID=2530456 RepID=A0A4R0Q826_9SPHI|nr:hypothetical protein [Pedobacter psychrodurus]TCD27786.1 hypothetical protein EZ456_07510 [Pedobacter psychrodurus]
MGQALKNNIFLYCILFVYWNLQLACKPTRPYEGLDSLVKEYSTHPIDSLRLSAALFLDKNGRSASSQKIYFTDQNAKEVTFDLTTVTSDSGLNVALAKNSYHAAFRTVYDIRVLEKERLRREIDMAIADWKTYPWAKQVPERIFLNNLLPYKIYGEYPDEWRIFSKRKLKNLLQKICDLKIQSADEVYEILINQANTSLPFRYSEQFTALTNYPSFTELNAIRRGDCLRIAYFNVYKLRSAGIPATIDIVPFWGDRNGGHAIDVFYRKILNGTIAREIFGPPNGQQLIHPPKVFRISFEKTNVLTDSIKPLLSENDSFLPSHLYMGDNLEDVTDIHTTTKDIRYTLTNRTDKRIAYICVYNGGEWKPLFYGKINKNSKIIFRKMGLNMLYHLALPSGAGYELIEPPFILSSKGKIIFFNDHHKIVKEFVVRKITNSDFGWVKKKHRYFLSVMNQYGSWQNVEGKIATRDSIITFSNIPCENLYRIVDETIAPIVSRPFSYAKGNQNWY